jgi:hypothetical protein
MWLRYRDDWFQIGFCEILLTQPVSDSREKKRSMAEREVESSAK